jgi:hypothetical protein
MWLLNRAADAQVEHFRLTAAESWALKRACYPMGVFKAKAPDSVPTPTTGSGHFLKIGVEEEIEWVAPSGAPFEILGKAIASWRTELYRLADQMAISVDNSASALDRSGLSKQADMAATMICLHGYAERVKATMEEVFELVSDGRGDVDVIFSIEGLDVFDLDTVTAALANIQTAKGLSIPSPTLTAELHKKAAALLLPDASQDKRDQINAEIDDAAKEPPKPPPVPPADDAAKQGDPEAEPAEDEPDNTP